MKINWAKLKTVADINGTNLTRLGEQFGFSNNYFCQMRRTNRQPKEKVIKLLEETLGCDRRSFMDGDEPEKEVAVSEELFPIEVTDFEKDVIGALKDISMRLANMNEAVMYLFNMEMQRQGRDDLEERPNFDRYKHETNETEHDRAVNMLKKMFMTANGGCIKFDDYKNRLNVMGIKDDQIIKDVLDELNYGVTTRGYGNNKCRWILELEEH